MLNQSSICPIQFLPSPEKNLTKNATSRLPYGHPNQAPAVCPPVQQTNFSRRYAQTGLEYYKTQIDLGRCRQQRMVASIIDPARISVLKISLNLMLVGTLVVPSLGSGGTDTRWLTLGQIASGKQCLLSRSLA